MRERVASGLLLALVVWAGAAFALELRRAGWLREHDPWQEERPSTWRLGCAAAERLEDFGVHLLEHVDPTERVLFAGEGPPEEHEVRALWLAYLVPELEVVPLAAADAVGRGELVVAYGALALEAGHPLERRLHPLYDLPGGALYLVR